MKMGCGIVSNVRSQPPFERREEILDMLEEKGFKTENIVDYLCRRRWFFLKEREAYSSIERMKSIRFLLALMRNY
jgi:hypothetical protein